jgi:hypothetical protein
MDDIVLILDCVDENLSETESNNSDNEISDNQTSDHISGTSDIHKMMGKGSSCQWVVRYDVKWKMKIWLLGAPQ